MKNLLKKILKIGKSKKFSDSTPRLKVVNGKNRIIKCTRKWSKIPEEKMVAAKRKFKEANDYARLVMQTPVLRRLYFYKLMDEKIIFREAIKDFLLRPVVDCIDCTDYTGAPSEIIRVHIANKYLLSEVTISIYDEEGEGIEQGVLSETETAHLWQYITVERIHDVSTISIVVTATDIPGNSGLLDYSPMLK